MPGTATRIVARPARGGIADYPGEGSAIIPPAGGWPAESPSGGSTGIDGVAGGGTPLAVAGGVGGDGSGAGPPALGEDAVVLGSLAVPTRAMCGEGPAAAPFVRPEL